MEVFERAGIAHTAAPQTEAVSAWRKFHLLRTQAVTEQAEVLSSNHLPIHHFPDELNLFELGRPTNSPGELQKMVSALSIPAFLHHRLIGTFAELDQLQSAVGPSAPMRIRARVGVEDFLAGRVGDPDIRAKEARNHMTNLLRKAWDLAMKAKGLRCQEMADGTNAWWFPTGLVHNDKLPVRKDGRRLSYRNVGGTRTKRSGSLYWHLGFSVRPKLGDAPHFVLKPRVMISEDQAAPIADRKRMNRLRKGICKLWFNPIWRDQTLGFVQWLADGNAGFHLPLADNAHCITADGPKTFVSPVSIAADDTASDEADEDREAAEKLADPAFLPPDDDMDDE